MRLAVLGPRLDLREVRSLRKDVEEELLETGGTHGGAPVCKGEACQRTVGH
ncbi:hypothetical protein [Streptomyces sp. NPDC054863]